MCTVALCLYAYKSQNTLVPCVMTHVVCCRSGRVPAGPVSPCTTENADRVGIIKSSGVPQKVFRNSPEV